MGRVQDLFLDTIFSYSKHEILNTKNLLKSLGPGLMFASACIGTSHLVLSTRAGAHHGPIFLLIIVLALLFKYPFFEFGARYAHATGHSLLHGYKKQGKWAVYIYFSIIAVNMFAVPAAVGAVCAGILSTMMGISGIGFETLLAIVLGISVLILLFGGYRTLDSLVKLIAVVLLITVGIAFIAVLSKGPSEPIAGFTSPPLLEGAGLALLISLVGWMPSGLETSTMHSIWAVEKMKSSGTGPDIRAGLFDFNLGYVFTAVLAFMFLTIGIFTVYGTGQQLEGDSTAFSNQLLNIFKTNLGSWLHPVFAIAAFGTIYGTLITVFDAFSRSLVWSVRALKFKNIQANSEQNSFLSKYYRWALVLMGVGAFLLFILSKASMIRMLEIATIISFVSAPAIAYINLKAMNDPEFPQEYKPGKSLLALSYIGLIVMAIFTVYYLAFGVGAGH